MRYEAKVEEGILTLKRKDGEEVEFHVGRKSEALADECLGELYDFHQCNDEFKDGDEIVVGDWVFEVRSFHVLPGDEDTKFAVLGLTREFPYRIRYEGVDGRDSKSFATLPEAAKYVRDRWQGVDYCSNPRNFHTDYAQYYLIGFTLKDVGKFEGEGFERTFVFND